MGSLEQSGRIIPYAKVLDNGSVIGRRARPYPVFRMAGQFNFACDRRIDLRNARRLRRGLTDREWRTAAQHVKKYAVILTARPILNTTTALRQIRLYAK